MLENVIERVFPKQLCSINPANLQLVGEVAFSSKDEIFNKVKLAHQAKKTWKMLGVKQRVAILKPLIAAFKCREKEILALTIKEMGKTLTDAQSDLIADFDYFEAFLNDGPSYIEDEITFTQGKTTHRIVYEPRGVVACIVPWNYPFSNFIWGVIPNLIVGNTVVFKHSEECPLVGKLIEEIMQALPDLPEGVFAEVYGDAETGAFLIAQAIDMIWFTGSSSVGKKIFDTAGKKQIKSILEMGGSNPAIVFEDARLETLIPAIYRGRFTNCGQVCDATKRLIVHKNIYRVVVEKLTQHLTQLQIGDPENAKTNLGPLAAMRQLELLEAQVQDAIDHGAIILTGGKRPEKLSGAYYLPTLITHIKNTMRIWREEVFGPVLPIVTFETEEEAIQLANDTLYGLGAAVYSENLELARRVAAQIEAGFVDINGGSHWLPCNPFGGYKISGMGVEHGRAGFQELCQIKVIAEG